MDQEVLWCTPDPVGPMPNGMERLSEYDQRINLHYTVLEILPHRQFTVRDVRSGNVFTLTHGVSCGLPRCTCAAELIWLPDRSRTPPLPAVPE